MTEAFRWYLVTVAIGGAGLLPAAALFPTLHSRGVLYARPLALVLVAVAAWWIGWSGLIAYGVGALAIVVVGLWSATAVTGVRRPDLVRVVLSQKRLLLIGELVFIAVFAVVTLARAQAPNAQSTEKPMDLLMLTAVHRAETFPPPDPWLSGETVSYYHLGHLATDAVGQLSNNGPEVSFNLGMATIGALVGAAIFGLVGDVLALSPLRRRSSRWVGGVSGVLALLWVAPLAAQRDIVTFVSSDANNGLLDEWWWWWDATRVLPGPITEFPAFSILLGDLHAHVLALPISLVAIGLAVSTFSGRAPLTWRSWLSHPARLVLAGVIFAALFMTNSWDILTFGLLWFGAAVAAFRRVGWDWPLAIFGAVRYLVPPVGAALLLAAPFIANFNSIARSVELVSIEASDPGNWLLIWLVPLLPLALGVAALRIGADRRAAVLGAFAAVLVVVAWAVLQLASGEGDALVDRSWGWVVLAMLVGLIGLGSGAVASAERNGDLARAGWIAIGLAVAVLMLTTEVLNIQTATSGRFNTVFKFWYHLWTLLALAGAVALAMVADRVALRALLPRSQAVIAATGLAAVVIVYLGAFVYAPAMALSRGREGQPTGLNALVYLERSDPGLAGSIAFAQENLRPSIHVLLQAVGEPYGPGGYLAAASGVPTVLSWPAHEIQWRGSSDGIAARRDAVAQIYTLGSVAEAELVTARFRVTHVYVGREERNQFGADVAARFANWDIAWEGSGSVIFVVPAADEVVAAS